MCSLWLTDRSDSVASGNESCLAITFLSIIDHECLQCLLGRFGLGHLFFLLLCSQVTLKISILFRNSSSVIDIYKTIRSECGTVFFSLQFIPTSCFYTLLCPLEPPLVSKQLWMTSGVSVTPTVISQHIKNIVHFNNVPRSFGIQF